MTTTITWEELVDFGLHGGYGCPLACPITMGHLYLILNDISL